MVQTIFLERGGMAEWLKAAVLKTVERKFRGFESYFLRHILYITLAGEMTELAEGARLLSECRGYTLPRVRIPVSPPFFNYKRVAAITGCNPFFFQTS
jgi:hypothetical protein